MNYLQEERRDVAPESAGGPSIGEVLRSAREARGDTLSDVAHALKLSRVQVEALEVERFDLLPGPVFVRGFLRNYARYLGLDPDTVTAGLLPEPPAHSVRLAPVANAAVTMPNGDGERKVLKPAIVVVCGMLLALLAGWYFDWFKVPGTTPIAVQDNVEPAPPHAPVAVPAAPPQQGSAPVLPLPEPVMIPGGGEPAPATGADALVQEPVADSTPPVAPVPEDGVAATEAVPDLVAEVQPEEPVLDPAVGQLVFRMEGESWIQVRDGEGVIVFTGTGAAGTSRTVQGKRPFSIVVGNAAMVSLEHDGAPVDLAPHTRSGGVARMTVE